MSTRILVRVCLATCWRFRQNPPMSSCSATGSPTPLKMSSTRIKLDERLQARLAPGSHG